MAQGKVNTAHPLVNRAMNYSAGNIFERGTQTFAQWLADRPSKVNKALSANKQKLIADIEVYASSKPNVFDAGCFNRDVLASLNEKQLKALSTLVSKIDYLYEHSATLLRDGDPYLADKNEELGKLYKSAVDEMSPYFEGVNLAKMFGVDSLQEDLNQLSNNIPTSADLELVEAFKRIGVNLSLHVNNSKISWQYDAPKASASNVEDMFRFKEEEVSAFTKGYLDRPLNERGGKVITPDGLFRVYKERGQQIINDRRSSGAINENDKNRLIADFQNKCMGLNTKDSNWEIGLLTNQEYIVKMAQSLALTEIAHDALDKTSQGDVMGMVSRIQENLNSSQLYQSSPDNRDILGRLGKECVNCADIVADNIVASSLGDIVGRYDDLLSSLEGRQQNLLNGVSDPVTLGQIESQIEVLKASKENLIANVEFLKSFAMQNAGNGLDKKQIMNDLQFSSGRYWVNSNKGEFEVVDRHSGVINGDIGASDNKRRAKEALADVIKARVLAKAKSGEVNTSKLDQTTKESVEKMYESGLLTYLIENQDGALGFASSMSDMYKLKIAEILFEEGAPFDTMAENYFAKNPTKSFDDFISEELPMADEKDGLFDRMSLRSAYDHRQVEKGEKEAMSADTAAYMRTVNQKYGESIVLLDRVLNSLTNEELANFHDPTYPSSAKTALINQKVIEAKRTLIVPTKGNKEYDTAMAKYNGSVLSNLLSTNLNDIKEMESETMTDGAVSAILEKYINQLQPESDTLGADTPQAKPQKDQYVTYGDLRQKTVDLIKFEKAMKGFSSKELKKNFIKPLLAGLKGKTKLNITAYEAKRRQMQEDMLSRSPRAKMPEMPEMEEGEKEELASAVENIQQKVEETEKQEKSEEKAPSVEKKNLKKKELEASAFLPASCMIDKVMADISAKEGSTSPKLGRLNDLKGAFQCLSSIDQIGNEFSQPIADGTDFRDACRDIAFDICKGNLKDPKDIQSKLSNAIFTYKIPNTPFVQQLKNGFENLTPELMNYLFEFSSNGKVIDLESGQKITKLTLGSKLPRGLDACKSDAERKALIKDYMDKNLINYNESSEIFDMLVSDIYLEKGASDGFGRNGDTMELDI